MLAVFNPDVLAREYSKLFPELTEYETNLKAVKDIEGAIPRYFELKRSFAVETVLSTTKYIDYWNRAGEKGFERVLIYISLESPDEAVKRVRRRVRRGGHNVPEKKIRNRFWRSLENFRLFASLADGFLVFENVTGKGYWVVACGRKGTVEILQETTHPIGKILSDMQLFEKGRIPEAMRGLCDAHSYIDFDFDM